MPRSKKIGLALGGGFVRGAAHIGVLRVLHEHGLYPDMVAGTSAGSMVAAFYGCGYSTRKIETLAKGLTEKKVYDYNVSLKSLSRMGIKVLLDLLHANIKLKAPMGLMKGEKLRVFMEGAVEGRSFKQLVLPVAITAVDLISGQKVIFCGQPLDLPNAVVISNESVAEAVRASTSVPGIFEPFALGNRLLVDGGVLMNVPAEVVRAMGADLVIAVDLSSDEQEPVEIDNILEVLSQSMEVMSRANINYDLEANADLVIRPRLKGVGIRDFAKIPDCIQWGVEAARRSLPQIEVLLAE